MPISEQLKAVMNEYFNLAGDEVIALCNDVTSLLTELGIDWQSPNVTFESVKAYLSHLDYRKIGMIICDVILHGIGFLLFTAIGSLSAVLHAVVKILDLLLGANKSLDFLREKARAIKQEIMDAVEKPKKEVDSAFQPT